MAYHDKHSPSLGSKTALLLLTLVGLVLAYKLLLTSKSVDTNRLYLLLVCASIFYLRLALCILVFVKRKISWFEGCAVGFLYGALLYIFSLWGGLAHSICNTDIVGGILFAAGSWVNSQSDYQRYKWKKKPENSGHLYTCGLFRYSMHINFLGDTVMFAGYALITQNGMSFIPVIAIILNFVLIQIPRLNDYLMKRYKSEFIEYSSKTKQYIPFIY